MAESSDSMAPSSAMVAASGSNAIALSKLNGGNDSAGRLRGTSPNRDTTVAMSGCSTAHRNVAPAIAIRKAGQVGRSQRKAMIMPTENKATNSAYQLAVDIAGATF